MPLRSSVMVMAAFLAPAPLTHDRDRSRDDDRHVRKKQLDIVQAHGPPPTSITSPTGGGVSRTEVRIRPPGESERLPRAGSAPRAAGWWASAPPAGGPGSHLPN